MRRITNHPPVPLSGKDVTQKWISEALGIKMSTNDFHIENDIQKGSGFLSSMVRLKCKSESDSQNFNLIVKLLPQEPHLYTLVVSEKFDKTEINFYEKVVPDVLEILPQLQKYLCKSWYGHVQSENVDLGLPYASVLVMEDLKPQGYYTINFGGEMSPEQMIEVTEFFAQFHFAGMALESKKNVKLPKLYDFLSGVTAEPENSVFFTMAKKGFVDVLQILKDYNASKEVINAYTNLAKYSDQIIEKVDEASKQFAALIHGDLWSNNLLFNDDPEHHTKVIDWQLLGYKDPTYDLCCAVVCSLSQKNLTKENVEFHFQLYYKTFVKQCKDSGYPELVTRDYDKISKFFYTWAMSYTLLWCLMTSDPFSIDFFRLVRIYEFLAIDINLPEFLLSKVK